eukprot:9827103-Karenia_brevis.AAC.1
MAVGFGSRHLKRLRNRLLEVGEFGDFVQELLLEPTGPRGCVHLWALGWLKPSICTVVPRQVTPIVVLLSVENYLHHRTAHHKYT